MKLALRILTVIDDTGPREPSLLQRLLRATDAEYQRAIGWLILKGMIVFKGKTTARKIHRNGRRMAGFAYVELAVGVVVLALITAGVLAVRSYLKDVDRLGYERGVAETSDGWRKRAAVEEAEYQEAYDALRAEMDASLTSLNGQLHDAQAAYEKEREDHEAQRVENARIERDLRAARLVLRDPGKAGSPAAGQACRGQGAVGAEAKPGGDGPAESIPGDLSPVVAGFLWAEASRADEVIEDLEERLVLAQDTVAAYYSLAERCH